LEIDLVAHCGQITDGTDLNTLTATDLATGWTEGTRSDQRDYHVPVAMLFYTEEVRTRAGAGAAASHTASIAGDYPVYLATLFSSLARLFATVWTNLTTQSHYLPCSMVKEQKVEGSQPSPTAAMSALRLQTIWGRWFYLILVKGQKPSLK